jgi:hypothetical protein
LWLLLVHNDALRLRCNWLKRVHLLLRSAMLLHKLLLGGRLCGYLLRLLLLLRWRCTEIVLLVALLDDVVLLLL